MNLNEVIARLNELRDELGGETAVESIAVEENTAHEIDGGFIHAEIEDNPIMDWHIQATKEGKVRIGYWNSYYST
jgi:hypothetical protein